MSSKKIWLIVGLVIGLMAGIVIGYGISSDSRSKAAQVSPSQPTIAQLLTLVNAERAKNGVAPLKEDPRLDASAQMKANDEITYNYYDHVSPKGSPYAGMNGYKLIEIAGLACVYESENLDENTDSAAALKAWIKSPAHHKAMIDAKYSITGFGIAGKDTNGYYQFVEHFCQLP